MTGTPVRIPVYQKRLSIFNCLDYLICLHIHNSGYPYQYTFSGNWGFYYYSPHEFLHHRKEAAKPPFYTSLCEIYHMKNTQADYTNLIDYMDEGGQLFTHSDGWYLPWTINYHRAHDGHYFYIQQYNQERTHALVIDWIPEIMEWVPIEAVNDGYIAGGAQAFRLTAPKLNMDMQNVLNLLTACQTHIAGWTDRSVATGIAGLQAFRKDMLALREEGVSYVEQWWDLLKIQTDVRDRFLEFIYFLDCSEQSPLYHTANNALIEVFEECFNKWLAFRNGLMKTVITGTYDWKRAIERLDKIILYEERCEVALRLYIEGMLAKLEHKFLSHGQS
ncbi:hypothetical protein KDC22_17270 [Paenibacillus tritici]|uniref:hypothetical protein n=1 Tax=Paenibacillus tritici TaxID=1873425 RepID=UPI001BAD3BC7|nr:hypothetical protein [Paenibacillus tritici]QUL52222.1 hypothetical protein KDC22_17270 [Paenibacillus tritici]